MYNASLNACIKEDLNIFCWNSSPIEKPTELHWYAHVGGWRPKPALLKAQAQTIFINFKI